MLEIKNISKYFSTKTVVDNLSFEVKRSRIFGLIGPNGAGKTTTLRIILNILLPTSGEIIFEGIKLDQKFLNLTGYLPEERGLYPKSSVLNTLIYLGQLKGKTHTESSKLCNYWLDRLKLAEFKNYHLEELSKGNQQKVQFIAAIQHNPKVLILDEPFSGFDPLNQTIFTEIINEIKNDKYIILSTHLMDLAEKLCDDFLLLNKGKEVLKGDLNEILNSYQKNIYEVESKNNLNTDFVNKFGEIDILILNENKLVVDLKNNNQDEFLKYLISQNSISSFRKVVPSLHQLFVSQVEGKQND
ncbi:MAG: ATP-binding cassette domain-containing protein [Ignavibacteriae bacterium]|nr:ATP-binding cassette domain-containing protein [Ignavibacteriota bacterium]